MLKSIKFLTIFFFFTSCGIFKPSPTKELTQNKQNAPYDAIIVPGVPYDGNHWSETMMARVKWSKYLYDQGYTNNIIYSGSSVYTHFIEAKVMALYAQAMGIPKERIFIEPRAEHTTENIYYSYRVAKKHHFSKIALATDPFQSNSMHSFIKKFEFNIDYLPIVSETLNTLDLTEPKIDATTAINSEFVSIVERESFGKRLKGTIGQNIRWQEEDLKTKRLRKKYGDRIEAAD